MSGARRRRSMAPVELTVQVVPSGKLVTLAFNDSVLSVKSPGISTSFSVSNNSDSHPERNHEVVLHQVIAAKSGQRTHSLSVSYLVRKRQKEPFSLVTIEGEVKDAETLGLAEWAESLMHAAYEGTVGFVLIAAGN